VIARAVGRACHFTVARVELAALAHRETVSLVRAHELRRVDIGQRHVLVLAVVQQLAVYGRHVHYQRVLAQIAQEVDAL